MTADAPPVLSIRLPADFTPEARQRFDEVASRARKVADRLTRDGKKNEEPAAVFEAHVKGRVR
jgi:hypothetical protein